MNKQKGVSIKEPVQDRHVKTASVQQNGKTSICMFYSFVCLGEYIHWGPKVNYIENLAFKMLLFIMSFLHVVIAITIIWA